MSISYGICHLSAVAIRAEASSKSEMISMLLFGESFSISEEMNGWVKINCSYDGYEGWLEGKQFIRVGEAAVAESALYCLDQETALCHFGLEKKTILLGSTLPHFEKGFFRLNDTVYSCEHGRKAVYTGVDALLKTARQYLHAPYLWGGRSPFGIDCSGFTQVVHKIHGIKLLRDARQQAEQGHTVDFAEMATAGDLAFFDNEAGQIVHVGILLSPHEIIHASGQVRIDLFDRQGIYNRDTQSYSHQLRLIKRISHETN